MGKLYDTAEAISWRGSDRMETEKDESRGWDGSVLGGFRRASVDPVSCMPLLCVTVAWLP